jgi:hypothetical protein
VRVRGAARGARDARARATNSDVTRFVDTEDTFLNTILTWNTKNNREIMEMHDNFYEKNHKESLKNALKIM